ncbi:MAG: phytoene/squalene synthase family protein [Thermogemmatispora sp.]|uniref:phytoene/squalene synthase family protein n=1 Tax=Thermogemmatispora sp. TaxID=1968838 RepID=UPI0019E51E4A|nr:phytoene/squalene synthase family protein [Thermogemmatispora sp.]MBE3567150.1 phytoene/squalene synthase family protein [Thermogemmatispora sp.]
MRVVKPSFQREGASSASAGPPEPEELASTSSLCSVPAAAASEAQEEALLAHHGRTFHFAARFLPGELRPSFVTLYAFFRTLDDLVDERGPEEEPRAIAEELRAWRAWFLADHQGPAPREPLGSRLTQVVERYGVPGTLFLDFLEGLHWDLWPREFASFSRLRAYCYRVAGTVGLALAHVLGATSEGALAAAESLGIAMQLTNILRDVGGDLRKGRLYLPLEDLTRFGLSRSHLQQLLDTGQGPDAAFRDLMRYEVARTHLCYAQSLPGVWLLPPDRRLPILLAGRLYRRILHAIEQHNYDVLRARAHTTLTEKLREAMLALTLDRLWRRGEQLGAFGLEVSLEDEP